MSSSIVEEIDGEISDIANNQRIWDQNNDDWSLRKARSNLFLDDNTRIEYLASQRFPNDKYAALKYINKDGNL